MACRKMLIPQQAKRLKRPSDPSAAVFLLVDLAGRHGTDCAYRAGTIDPGLEREAKTEAESDQTPGQCYFCKRFL